jgi:hypothetical protein
MGTKSEEFVTRSTSLTGNRMFAVASAFGALVGRSWPKPAVVRAMARAERQSTELEVCASLLAALDVAYAEFPTAMFWWKNERSEFLGFCPRLAAASGVAPLELLGRSDADPAVVWNRQAALYMRDDREVMSSRAPRFDIIERQDRGDTTVWLRTSKVPYDCVAGAGTVGGFDTISAVQAAELARKRR